MDNMILRTGESSSSNGSGRDIIPSFSSKLFRHNSLDIDLIDDGGKSHLKKGIVKYGKMTDEPAIEVNNL